MGREGASFALPRPGWRALVAGVLALAVIVVVVVARFRGGDSANGPSALGTSSGPASSEPDATASASVVPADDDGVEGGAAAPYTQPAAAGALDAATRFVKAWADHPDGVTPAAWSARVAKYADPALGKQLELTEPQLVPATAVTGKAESLSGGVSSASVAVPTDTGRVVLTCTLVNGQWRVSDVDLERRPR